MSPSAGTWCACLLYTSQEAIDAASAEADYVVALGHLGVDASSQPWTSREVIANTTGLDAFIDGHSHTTVEMREVTDEAGETVVLTQTGSYLDVYKRQGQGQPVLGRAAGVEILQLGQHPGLPALLGLSLIHI